MESALRTVAETTSDSALLGFSAIATCETTGGCGALVGAALSEHAVIASIARHKGVN
jgi:hypothetical protein